MQQFAERLGITFTDFQVEALEYAEKFLADPTKLRTCLYYKTGAGKSITALVQVALLGFTEAIVITPPSTFPQWEALGRKLGVNVTCMSHAKFRQKDTKLSRTVPVIADEMHLFGGHKGQGWKKLDTLAAHLQAPLVLASATPNYNDAERVYCIQHVLNPGSCRGGYIEFLYRECDTEANPFAREPKVLGFRNYPDAAAYLAALPGVLYLPDDLVWSITDHPIPLRVPRELYVYGLNERAGRIIASQIEERHALVNLSLITDTGLLDQQAYDTVMSLVGQTEKPSLVFAAHSTVAEALAATLRRNGVAHDIVTGGTTGRAKADVVARFNAGKLKVLIGTATLATGTDGMDKVCDQLIILDDTDDDSMRRQLVGRIMPRGLGGDASTKSVHRLLLT